MHAGTTGWATLDEAAREAMVRTAGASIREGGLAIVPTETVYGVMAHAGLPGSVERLREEAGPGVEGEPRFTWHAADVASVRDVAELPTAVHNRLISRLLPGPVRFVLEQGEDALASATARLGVGRGVIDAGGWMAVRVCAHEVARRVIGWAGVPVVAERLGSTRWRGKDMPDHELGETGDFPGVVVDVGELPVRGPSTTVRLRRSGAFEVLGGGSLKESDVMEALRKRILFVCTGNTCRSPMAEAIARTFVADGGRLAGEGVEVVFESAGVSTGDGLPASPEAVRVVGAMGGDLRSHRSRWLTAAMVERAEHVFVMTGSHRERVLSLSPGSAGKVSLLDPRGEIPDPIGGPEEVYRETAERLRALIAARFEELGL